MASNSNQAVLSSTTSRLQRELMDLIMNPPNQSGASDACGEISAFPANEANILHWKALIVGPKVRTSKYFGDS